MRTTTAAALAATTTSPLFPQPHFGIDDFNENKISETNETLISHDTAKSMGENFEKDLVSEPGQSQQTIANRLEMNPVYPNTTDFIYDVACTASTELKNPLNEKMGAFYNPNASAAANVTSMLQAAGFGKQPSDDLNEKTRQLARELEDFVDKGIQASLSAERCDPGAPSGGEVADLQLQTARMLRHLLPRNRDLLHLVQEKKWIPLLLGWLNLHDRPAVQVEALLTLTNIAELCQQSYYQQSTVMTTSHASSNISLLGPLELGGKSLEQPTEFQDTSAGEISQKSYSYPACPKSFSSVRQSGISTLDSSNPSPGPQSPFMMGNSSKKISPAGSFPISRNEESGLINSECSEKTNGILGNPVSMVEKISTSSQLTKGAQHQHNLSSKTFHFGTTLQPPLQPSSSSNIPCSTPYQSDYYIAKDVSQMSSTTGLPSQTPSLFLTPPVPQTTVVSGSPVPMSAGVPAVSEAVTELSEKFALSLPDASNLPNIPQPLSASSQHLLLRHADAIPTLISLLSSPNREVHEQSMWILGSIAAGEPNRQSVGEVPSSPSTNNSSISCSGGNNNADKLSNISAKEIVLAAGVMTPLLNCLDANPQNLSLQRIGSWALSNLVETKVQGKIGNKNNVNSSNSIEHGSNKKVDIRMILPTLRRLLSSSDAEVLSYTCWTLSHMCDGPSSNIALVVTSTDTGMSHGDLVPRLVDLLLHPSWRVTKPALRTIGNIVCAECGEDVSNKILGEIGEISIGLSTPTDYTEVILDCGAVPRLKHLISHSNREIQKEACWTLSNIAAGTVDQIQAVIESEAIPPLVRLVNEKVTDQEVRSEACWVVLNATSCGSDQQIEILVAEGCVSVLGLLLEETSMVTMALEGLERVLQVEENREKARRHRVANQIKVDATKDDEKPASPLVSASLIEKALEKNNSNAVSKRAGRIWKQHFVSCALCHQSFSKHRLSDARFCKECKCHVCSSCSCEIYHLSYQEELWAVSEEKNEASKKVKKNKKQKKREKLKARKAKEQDDLKVIVIAENKKEPCFKPSSENFKINKIIQPKLKKYTSRCSRSSTVTSSSENNLENVAHSSVHDNQPDSFKIINGIKCVPTAISTKTEKDLNNENVDRTTAFEFKNENGIQNQFSAMRSIEQISKLEREAKKQDQKVNQNIISSTSEDEEDFANKNPKLRNSEIDRDQPPVDFVLYLQQTGSIIALARLMDALDEGHDNYSTYHEEMHVAFMTNNRSSAIT